MKRGAPMANILIADDEKEIVRLLRMYIEANDHIVFEANDGQEALQILDRENIELAIVDIMMPKKNGYEIIKEIRKGRYIPILVISAKVELSDRVFGIDLGADDYITKPFEPLEVAAKVRAHLRRAGVQTVVVEEKNVIEEANEQLQEQFGNSPYNNQNDNIFHLSLNDNLSFF